jgi:hypothetical protein
MTAPATVRSAITNRPLLIALYIVALALALPPLMEYLLVSMPYRLGNTQWRFGAVGLFVNSFAFSPLLGLALALFASVQLGHRRTARVFSVLAIIAGVGILLALPLFLLDFLQVRAGVNPQAKLAFTLTSTKAAISGVIMGVTGLALGIAGWRSTGVPGLRAAGRAAAPRSSTIMVGSNQAEASQA